MFDGQTRLADNAPLVAIFSALGEPLRMEIVKQMIGVDVLPCTQLEETLPISKSTISYHVKILYHANLIEVHKQGRYYFYRLKRDVLEQWLPGLLERLGPEAKPKRRQAKTTTNSSQRRVKAATSS